MANPAAGMLRHARGAFLLSIVLFAVIVYHHSIIQSGYSERMSAARSEEQPHWQAAARWEWVLAPAEGGATAACEALSARVCGSPAMDGYAHVNASCLRSSPAARWWRNAAASGRLAEKAFLEAHVEQRADYDGVAVKWGLGHKAASAQACAQACLDHVPAPALTDSAQGVQDLPCNAFSWCGDASGCFEPDIHRHEYRDCWLKFAEAPLEPEVNMRGELPPDFRARHPRAPVTVQWASGVLLPAPLQPGNGTWSPRYSW
ncbi:hypothetical protein WJX81_000103 [Elliptochloris bilobata]|uniref:Apple domain-containing protein n=1 Tax=Elliptochloris bilobata TaxID=381761 RepID=A0AAW1SH74_9CHLO